MMEPHPSVASESAGNRVRNHYIQQVDAGVVVLNSRILRHSLMSEL
jgi:hypothetical protein